MIACGSRAPARFVEKPELAFAPLDVRRIADVAAGPGALDLRLRHAARLRVQLDQRAVTAELVSRERGPARAAERVEHAAGDGIARVACARRAPAGCLTR